MTSDSAPENPGSGWYVVWTEARAEKAVAPRLDRLGYESWLPIYTATRQWSDRKKQVTLPLFPGYLFCRTGPGKWHDLLRVPGVLTLVKAGSAAAVLTDDYVEGIKQAISSPDSAPEPFEEPPEFAPGDQVVVLEGPLAGLTGVVKQLQSRRVLVIWVELIGRGVACTIGTATVARVTESY
jgi:transcription antitermination factor NusG